MSRRQAIHADLSDNLSTLLGHMATYFPFAVFWPVASKRDVKVRQNFIMTAFIHETIIL